MADSDGRLLAYDRMRARRPELFANPPGAATEILFDPGARHEVPGAGVVYQDPWVTVLRDPVRFRSGALGAYVRTVPSADGPGAAVLPITGDGRVVLVHHFRHSTRAWHWEAPRGFGEDGADGPESARRELEEELGVPAAELIPLGGMYVDTGGTTNRTELFAARLAAAPTGPPPGAADEGIDAIRTVTPAELAAMISDGSLSDSFTLAAYARALVAGLLPPPA